jgi:hypothetical protein
MMDVHRRRRALGIVALSAALLAGSACADDGSDVEVLFANYLGPAALQDPALLRVDLATRGPGYRLTGSRFTTQRYGTLHSDRLAIPGRGELRVSVALVAPPADTLGRVTVTVPLQSGYHYGVLVQPGGARPSGICIGQLAQAPLRRPGGAVPTDTLWVTYAGLPDGAIC